MAGEEIIEPELVTSPGQGAGPETTAQIHGEDEVEFQQEFVTNALYLSLSLLAVTLATPHGKNPAVITVLVTALGLLLAHLFAYSLATRMFNNGVLGPRARRLLGVQAIAGLVVAAIAVLPVWLIPAPAGIYVAALLLLALIMVVGYKVARNGGKGRGLSALNVVAIAVTVGIIVAVKSLAE